MIHIIFTVVRIGICDMLYSIYSKTFGWYKRCTLLAFLVGCLKRWYIYTMYVCTRKAKQIIMRAIKTTETNTKNF